MQNFNCNEYRQSCDLANNANANTLCFDIKTAENPENSCKHALYNELGIRVLYANALSD